MAKNVVVVLTRELEDVSKKLHALNLPDLEIIVPKDPYNALEETKRANILFAIPSMAKKYINEAKGVVWMQSSFTGIDAMNDESLRKDYVLTNVRDVYGEVMAEYVFSYILLFEKEIIEYRNHQNKKEWSQKESRGLRDKTICILGAGSIGKVIASLAKKFHMRTLGYHRGSEEKIEYFDELFTDDGLKDCLPRADYVVSVLPKTKDTDDVINKNTLAFLKETAVFMNIGRGNAVKEEDLIEALKSKRIAKAVLDVFKVEPLPSDSPFWTMDNVYITPHMAGYIINDKVMEIFAENYKRFIAGKELIYKIDLSRGY